MGVIPPFHLTHEMIKKLGGNHNETCDANTGKYSYKTYRG